MSGLLGLPPRYANKAVLTVLLSFERLGMQGSLESDRRIIGLSTQ